MPPPSSQSVRMPPKKKGRAVEEVKDTGPPAIVKHADMPDELTNFVTAEAKAAMVDARIEKDIATTLKKKMDETQAGSWHVVVGQSFGVSLTHETRYIVFFSIGLLNFVVFKTLDDDTPVSDDK